MSDPSDLMTDPTDHDPMIADALDAWAPLEPPAGFADRVLRARATTRPAAPARRRAWLLAAPLGAAAVLAIVLFAGGGPKGARDASPSALAAEQTGEQTAEQTARPGPATGSGGELWGLVNGVSPIAIDAGAPPPVSYVDGPASSVVVAAGASAFVHTTESSTAVQIDFAGRCPSGGTVLAHERGETVGPAGSGRTHAVVELARGSWSYELRCAGSPSVAAAAGSLVVVKDDGSRALLPRPRPVTIDADGRTWRVSFTDQVPALFVRAERAQRITVGPDGGAAMDVPVVDGVASIPGAKLGEGRYLVVPEPVTSEWKATTLVLDHDVTAPILTIGRYSEPPSGGLVLRGQVQDGWSVDIGGVPATIDRAKRTFVGQVRFGANVVRATHPTRVQHLYVQPPVTR